MFFDSWQGLLRVILVGAPAYALLIVCLRISGKRTLSKMNAFDLVVTVALGSTLSSILISKDVALAEGGLALALLIALQFAIAWTASRSGRVAALVKADPTLLFYRGEFLHEVMQRERVARSEVLAAMRAAGTANIEDVEAVVLETAGELSVIPCGGGAAAELLSGVQPPRAAADRGATQPH